MNSLQRSKQMEVGLSSDEFFVREGSHVATRPSEPAPSRRASIEERAEWSQRYVSWFIAQTPTGPLPADLSPTHRYEVEFEYCMLDPQRYERETQQELARQPMFH